MSNFDFRKYPRYTPLSLPDRQWPNQSIDVAPHWCSVDLRDGNQALMEPMTVEQKERLFNLLVKVGFKEIEVGFPAASQPDYEFVRLLIEKNLIPDDVTIQVLVQCREELIARTFQALQGAARANVHIYNSTSTVQREKVFAMNRDEIREIAVQGARWVQDYAAAQADTEWTFQYSPESFTGTEMDFALEVCNAVIGVWQPASGQPVVINLPATVEVASPNVYADQIEWMGRHLAQRDAIRISLHTHNDRGCAVAAAELGVMAGADRVEGTLLGNGERTGNMDIVTMAMNLYSQGVDPALDLSGMDEIVSTVKHCTQLPVHPRHPYAGELVFTAFSGSHQDAIKKCLDRYSDDQQWQIAYLPLDPSDIGRSYDEVIRINSQSGKGGVAYVLEKDYGLQLPRWLQIEFSKVVQEQAEIAESELSSATIYQLFADRYLRQDQPLHLERYQLERSDNDEQLQVVLRGEQQTIVSQGQGCGLIDAMLDALQSHFHCKLEVVDYSEHALTAGSQSDAVSYLAMKCNGERCSGVAIHQDVVVATLNAVLNAFFQAGVLGDEQAA